MMKTIVFLKIFLLVLGFVLCNKDTQSVKKCHAFSGEDANTNLENAVEVYKNCFNASLANFRHLVATTTCVDITPIKECNRNMIKKIEDCNSADKSYFPKNVFKLISDYAQHICSKAELHKLPILLEHKICYPSLSKGIDCFHNFRFFNVSSNLSREEMCMDEIEVSGCFMQYIENTCPSDSSFQQLINETFNFNQPPCTGGSQIMVGNIILMTIACSAIFKML